MEKSIEKSTESFIIDDQDAGLFRVNRKAFIDPECLQQERRRVFDKCWLYIGHESEVPHAGDFRSRNLAGRPLILVSRDECAYCSILALIAAHWSAARNPA